MEYAQTFSVRQHVKVLPKKVCACPPCAKQENTFSIYAGLNQDQQMEVLRADEISDDWNRCCCGPSHPFKLEVRQYISVPGDSATSDYAHLSNEMRNDWGRFTNQERDQAMRDMYKNSPVLFTILRNDGQRCFPMLCCCALPCKCLSFFVCHKYCQDGVKVYAGQTPEIEKKELGRPYNPSLEAMLGSVTQPIFGGCCHPELHLREGNADEATVPYGKVDGPCFFGGWSEMCCDFKFYTSYFTSPTNTGDIALITKKKPQSMAGAAQELCAPGNADNYQIQYNVNTKLSASQKVG
jgi:hypothetical protein